ncbi:hypothetical protein [Paraburkholderia sp. RL17-347-BIC-D]|uniref:hypothetical protein n=1 Tax=Paraburkholderia sp. RL17-347-BIC-D TaxID=3031632 RepID=UPI0038B7189D
MSINLTPFEHDVLCRGNTWVIADEDVLAQQIARVALGQSRHVQRILAGALLATPATTNSAAAGAIELLTVSAGDDPWHRDGWMFQVLSWIAAHRATPGGIIRAPHTNHAHKGFDGLELELDHKSGTVTAAVIFEDKATDNPRRTIQKDVWPEFKAFESGERENVLVAEMIGLLATQPNVDPDIAIQNVIWKNVRHYRISITVGDAHSDEAGRRRLFKGYDEIATGPSRRRRGETFHVKNLRQWMQSVADKAIAAVQVEVKPNV